MKANSDNTRKRLVDYSSFPLEAGDVVMANNRISMQIMTNKNKNNLHEIRIHGANFHNVSKTLFPMLSFLIILSIFSGKASPKKDFKMC